MLLNIIKKEFDSRHEFDNEDVQTLKDRWPNITFYNIPLSWIFPIDEMLCKLKYDNPIYEIRQEFGHLIVLSKPLKSNQKSIIKRAEDKLYYIDLDLHNLSDIEEVKDLN